ncbi:hypothetical protein G7059_03050 [Erysipelothrix sp. HDW6A]|uniref:MucBP domain-containing protein n=1 Tax=Erysipelothrix sp. HDW6A TaxID=2714928 RepID=UPI00140A1128|nr:MucBP domain-containing protein [Erysipelothrix sp. HDW6A]QIK56897.1 hypothetical protein G7059_03050 [Erysipelothrix sp. HDW6A]
MKKFYKMIVSILITLFVLVSPLSINAENQEKTGRQLIPDPVFYKYIMDRSNLSPDFTAKDLEEKVTSIRYYPVNNERIKDITGIEHMTNLKFIDLQFNDISSLEPLRKAESYPELDQLMLSNYIPTYSYEGTNVVTDLSMLSGTRFPKLTKGIHLVNTKITDEVLATLPQEDRIPKLFIDLQGNEITNIEPLRVYRDANIVRLDFNKIKNIEPISEMNEFYYISLQNNLISDLSGLEGFEGSIDGELILHNNNILDLSPLNSFKGSWINAAGFSDHTSGYFPEEGTYWNGGQRVKLTTPVIGNLETGEVTVESSAIYVDGDLSPIVENSTNMIDGDVIGASKKYILDPSSTDSISYVARSYFNVNGVNVAYYGTIEQPIIWKSSQSSVNVHYVDEEGNKLVDSIELDGTIGDSYITEKIEIEGYTLKEIIGEPTGIFEDTIKTVSYVYTKNTPVVNKYTVRYTDGVDNEVIFEDQVYSNIVENSQTPSFQGTPTRSGYTFEGWLPNVAETVTGDATYVAQWKKIEVVEQPTEPTVPTEPETPKLPTTGVSDNQRGLTIVALGGLLMGINSFRKKNTSRNHKKEE